MEPKVTNKETSMDKKYFIIIYSDMNERSYEMVCSIVKLFCRVDELLKDKSRFIIYEADCIMDRLLPNETNSKTLSC